MPQENEGQVPTADGQDPQAGTTPTPVADASALTQDVTPKDTGDPKVDDQLRRARDEAAKFRTQLRENQQTVKELQEQLKAKDDDGKSELQKAMDKVAEMQGKWQQADEAARRLRLQNEVILTSSKLDIVDADAAFRLLDKELVEYDGDKPVNINDLLEDLITERPYLKAVKKDTSRPAPARTSPTQPAQPAGKNLTMDDIQGMSSAEINARWDEVKPILAAAKGR